MIHHFEDYYWKNGIPRGKGICPSDAPESFKIVIDPYFKRISLEQFAKGVFIKTIYDSYLLDFRHLKPNEQTAWQKLPYQNDQGASLIVNQDDRAILIEKYFFKDNLCNLCEIYSVHGISLAKQKLFYAHLGDPFNGVILYDKLDHPIMIKKYQIDSTTNAFSDLISEEWDMNTLNLSPKF